MSELIIVAGLMGCGKTTFAKEYAKKFDYEYINFDLEYHTKIQKSNIVNFPKDVIVVNLPEDIIKLFENLRTLLNKNPSENFIMDGWFKWHQNWWQDEEDNTLKKLQEILKFHNIKIIHIFLPFKEVYKRYVEKHKKDTSGELERVKEHYKNTMEERQKNLNTKILKWATQ